MAESQYWLGFQSKDDESEDVALPLVGTLPYWLKGSLLRNGPAKYEVGNETFNHWFDGFAKLHKFVFESEQVRYSSVFVRSKAYVQAQEQKKVVFGEFATNPVRSPWQKLLAIVAPRLTDNTNVNVGKMSEHWLAMTETSTVTQFDLAPLHTMGHFQFDDKLSAQITTAHPHYDFNHTTLYNLLVHISSTSKYMVYGVKDGTRQRKLLATIPIKSAGYMHSFAMSENYIILVEFSLLLNGLELAFSGKPYIENYHWQADHPTRFYVVNKHDGQLTATFESYACFAFHHVNAYEIGNDIVVDIAAYNDAAIIKSLYLSELKDAKSRLPIPELTRFVLNLNNKQIRAHKLSDMAVELPRINYQACNSKNYKYLYGTGMQVKGDFLNQLVKIEIGGSEKAWREDGCYPGEAVFIADPHKDGEDDGVVVSVVLDSKNQSSFLLILDAKSLQEIARAQIPNVVPFGFHGQFLKSYGTEV